MTWWRPALMALGAVVVLGMGNLEIRQKQHLVDNGREVLLPLAPADPRALMQGDYMTLRFDRQIFPDWAIAKSLPWRGTVVLTLDADGVARFARLDDGSPLGADEVLMAYRRDHRRGGLLYGSTSFFFQEGDADLYTDAKFGVLRVNEEGASLLVGLAGEDGGRLGRK